MKKFIRITMYAFILLFLILNIIVITSTKKEVFGLSTIKVHSTTMEPTIKEGNLVIYTKFNKYKHDDIIVTKTLNKLYVNRIHEINNYLVTTINDNKDQIFVQKNIEDIEGKVILIINFNIMILYFICLILCLTFILFDLYTVITKKNYNNL